MGRHSRRFRRRVRGVAVVFAMATSLSAQTPMTAGAAAIGTPGPRIASYEGGVEAAIDAPWRLEPDASADPVYPRIPIVVSIHDSSLQSTQGPTVALGVFCEMAVREEGASTWTDYFRADRLSEVERSDKWPINSAPASNHRLCRRWAGETCGAADLDVGPSAEWHGTLLYSPHTQTPGADVHLTVQVRVARAGESCATVKPIVDDAPFDHFGLRTVYSYEPPSYFITNRLSVHLGEAALPRFDDGWAYGDLHYHSQGTDNEGESAYAYRPTLQAMRAMGLDFLFATEHASDSEQITDVNLVYLRNIIPDWVPGPIHDWLERLADSIPIHEEVRTYAARDMNQRRFEALRALLNDPPGTKVIGNNAFPTGANTEVMKVPGAGRPARIFLGGEVDVVPEMDASEKASGQIRYGNGATYTWRTCAFDQEIIDVIHEHTTSLFCPNPDALAELDPSSGQYWVHDIQGIGDDSFYARQHMVYLPIDGARDDAFVSGATSEFGGAHERLADLVDPTYYKTIVDKGYAFLAHPADGETGTGATRLGPDLVPYSDVQLRTAFNSPSVLGLQLWNEDTRLRTTDANSPLLPGFPLQPWDSPPDPGPGPQTTAQRSKWLWGRWTGLAPGAYAELYHGLAMWDRMLLWGLRPSQTAGLSWLAPGEPRRVFMAGGSDAHGDWNYRRQGHLFGVSALVDSAIGKPRNLVHVGLERPEVLSDASGGAIGAVGQGQATAALASGDFSVTDGPALRIALDANANGIIDDQDVPMGGVSHAAYKGIYVPFVVEWKSTDEFGPLAGIDLYVGASSASLDTGLMYAPERHGVFGSNSILTLASPDAYVDSAGGAHRELRDGYMLDPTGRLHLTLTAAQAKAGRRVLYLRANDFVVGRRRVEQEEPVCTWTGPNCNKPGHTDQCEETCTTPPPPTYHFDAVSVPDRVFVRAFARTVRPAGALCSQSGDQLTAEGGLAQASGQCVERLAFTNPVWMDNQTEPSPGSFTIDCAPSRFAVTPGGVATSACTVTSLAGFSQPVTLACQGLPSGAACGFSPTAVTPAPNGSVTSTLTLGTSLMAPPGGYLPLVKGTSGGVPTILGSTTISLTISTPAPPPGGGLNAAFNARLHAPACTGVGTSCDTGLALVPSRSAAGGEPNAPNTIGASCADGASGPARDRWNAIDAVRISTGDGTSFAAGKGVVVEATVWASATPTADAVDFYYAADAVSPSWQLISSVIPSVSGAQTITAKYRLPAGTMQAVRVQYRQRTTTGVCAAGALNDRDDLAFAVGATP